jgi:biotin transporter BioY
MRRAVLGIRALAVIFGALVVALAAQMSVPLPGTPVPMTLQPFAVLLVGGLLGPELGAISMIVYLAMGAAGLPVFTPTVPLVGIARLLGPTGGYLLAYPVAAWAVGRLTIVPPLRMAERGSGGEDGSIARRPGGEDGSIARRPGGEAVWRAAAGAVAGLVLIHLGGLAQLYIITHSIAAAAQLGTWPFLLGDFIKLVVLVPLLFKLTPAVRARL